MPEIRKDSRRLYLIARNEQTPRTDRGPAVDAPEAPLEVSFVGISEAEQRAALAAFPGGRRFRLKLVSGG